MEEAATDEVAGAPVAAARPRAQATLVLGLLALVLSIVGWTSVGRDAFVIDRRAFWGEPWRFFAAPLAHEHVVQLLVSLAGLWFFGRAVERRVGTGRLLAIVGLFALGTGFAEQALDHGSSGLTGIDFGLWALLVAAGVRNQELRGAVPIGLSMLMVAILLVCSFTLPVSNWGHGAGALLGVLAGLCLDRQGEFRQALVPLAALLLLVLGAGATRWRTSWNFGGASVEYDRAGVAALDRGDEAAAEKELRTALAFDEKDGDACWNLGLVLVHLDRTEEAAEAWWRAYENGGLQDPERANLEELLRSMRKKNMDAGEARKALTCAARLARIAPNDLEAWETVRELAYDLGDDDSYDLADRECTRLEPGKH
jgi:membrane associated rhomboid family serine protease